jgi:hypothetical protein
MEVAALRAAIAVVDNAEAVDAPTTGKPRSSSEHIAGASLGAGSTELARRELSARELQEILNEESAGLITQASAYEALGRTEEAQRLRSQAEVMRRYHVGPEAEKSG